MEALGGILGVLLLLVLLGASGSNNKRSVYNIEENNGYFEVKDENNNVVFAGTEQDCQQWIQDNG